MQIIAITIPSTPTLLSEYHSLTGKKLDGFLQDLKQPSSSLRSYLLILQQLGIKELQNSSALSFIDVTIGFDSAEKIQWMGPFLMPTINLGGELFLMKGSLDQWINNLKYQCRVIRSINERKLGNLIYNDFCSTGLNIDSIKKIDLNDGTYTLELKG